MSLCSLLAGLLELGGCENCQATRGQDDPWPIYDPLCTLVHSTEKGDVICYYGNRGEPEPIVLEPGESSLVGGDRVGGGGGGLLLWGPLCTFLRLSLCLISLLRLSVLLGHLCTLRPIAACGEHLVHILGCLKLRSPFPQGRAHDCPERIGN